MLTLMSTEYTSDLVMFPVLQYKLSVHSFIQLCIYLVFKIVLKTFSNSVLCLDA